MNYLWLTVAIISSYLLGSIPSAFLYVKALRGIDIREYGSHNPGATNVMRVMGKKHGAVVLLADLLKGYLAVHFFTNAAAAGIPSAHAETWAAILTGLMAIGGHNWSVWLGFRGGRGVATSAGVFLALQWQAFLVALVLFLIVAVPTRVISVASISAALVLPVALFFFKADPILTGFGVVAALMVVVRHIPNIKRLIKGEEKGFKKDS